MRAVTPRRLMAPRPHRGLVWLARAAVAIVAAELAITLVAVDRPWLIIYVLALLVGAWKGVDA